MNFFKSLVATAIATATIFVAPEAKAATFGQQALMRALDEAGVEYTAHECASHGLTDMYGFFQPDQNWIHVCTDVATTNQLAWMTMRHEAVHAAQFCLDPSMSSTLASTTWLFANGSQEDWDLIQQHYEQEDHLIELEAFTLMRESNLTIAELVNAACN